MSHTDGAVVSVASSSVEPRQESKCEAPGVESASSTGQQDRSANDDVQEAAVVTPLPIRQIVPLLMILLSESLCATMLFPIVGYLVAELEGESTNDAGYLAGILVGSFQLGQVISGKFWGRMSDHYGRRPILLTGVFFSGVVMLGFGLAQHFWLCVALRFLHGLLNGNVLVAKAVVADITDKTNESKGFTLISLSWGLGSLIGPVIGGFLYRPGHLPSTPSDDDGGGHPALLPSAVIFLYSELAVICGLWFLEESNPHAHTVHLRASCRDVLSNACRVLRSAARRAGCRDHEVLDVDETGDLRVSQQDAETDKLTSVPATSVGDSSSCCVVGAAREPEIDSEGDATRYDRIPKLGYYEAFASPGTRGPLILYGILCAADVAYLEIFPLWGISSREAGGLALSPEKVGELLVINSVPCIASNFLFPIVRKWFDNDMALWHCSAASVAAAILVTPLVTSVVPVSAASPMGLVAVLQGLRQLPVSWMFSLSFILISRSASSEHRGAINGIGQSVGSAVRAIVPPVVAPVFAWSIAGNAASPHVFPFNHCLVFVLAAVTMLASVPVARKMGTHAGTHSSFAADTMEAAELTGSQILDHEAEMRRAASPLHHSTGDWEEEKSPSELSRAETLSL